MIDFLKNLMAGPEETPKDHDEELRLVAAALLFRAVHVDGQAGTGEVEMVRRIIHDEFGLDDDATLRLMDEAETAAKDAGDLYGWTKRVNTHYSVDEKRYLMQKLWQVVLADDHVDSLESAMMRRLAGLIYVTDGDSAKARQAAIAEMN
jgi:uncharacterized tellurite resistance protein B-like protein